MARRVKDPMRQWALIGAEQRLSQLAQEAAAIHAAFPELRRGTTRLQRTSGRGRRGRLSADTSQGIEAPRRRRRRKMSAAARKRISDAQKARWAKQKASKKA